MTSETVDRQNETVISRPPGAVIAMSMLWGLGGCMQFMLWIIERRAFDLIFAVFAAVFTVLILKGVRWVFWVNLGLLSLSLGVRSLQLQIPGWARGTSPMVLWLSIFITVGVIFLHQAPSLRRWFGIRNEGKRWQMVFWFLVAILAVLGQFVLPALKALGVLIRGS